ncbi:MAG: hypothetical protein EPN22_14120 [Nitrospirae bacterium]|nr:MAG: hypothetical protein EPN22_14120 [Nitrospirota bacterium]
MFDGKCKDSCAENESTEQGAFLDCTEKQECCVQKKETKKNAATDTSSPEKRGSTIEKKDNKPGIKH